MPMIRSRSTQDRIDALAGSGVVRSSAWRAAGLSPGLLAWFARSGGPWQQAAPGVYVTHNGALTDDERIAVAMAYAGDDAVLTGRAALRDLSKWGISVPATITVLVAHARRRKGVPGIEVERTRRLPEPVADKAVRTAPVARAIIDAARRERDPGQIRHLVGLAVQRRKTTVEELRAELEAGSMRGTAQVRRALGGAAAGVRGNEEARVRAFLRERGLPEPVWNAHLYNDEGEWVAYVDGFLNGVVFETQSRAYHLYLSGSWETDLARLTRLGSYGAVIQLASKNYLQRSADEFDSCVRRAIAGDVGRGCSLRVGPPPDWWGPRAA